MLCQSSAHPHFGQRHKLALDGWFSSSPQPQAIQSRMTGNAQ
jgi:hypothetical protein